MLIVEGTHVQYCVHQYICIITGFFIEYILFGIFTKTNSSNSEINGFNTGP